MCGRPGGQAQLTYCGLNVDREGLRFAYKLANNQIGLLVLSEGFVIDDYPAGRALARRAVMQMLGEKDFNIHVSDTQLVDYQFWLAHVPGGQSYPLSALPDIFDPIFRRDLAPPLEQAEEPASPIAA
ncbi:MAG: hypothetical protein FJX29_12290 [Alphaproteobacteria bacterium]|nr:hypothetical protein [Alphaproteobacteria bacterium]